MAPNDYVLTKGQQEFIDRARNKQNLFLTGKAGTGKSFIVRELIARFTQEGKKVIAVAPTGVAANNIDGQTIHSLFGLTPFGVLTWETCNFLRGDKREVLRAADVIIIDEVSMLRPDVLDAMDLTMKKNGVNGLASKQVIFVGDLKQLPPVINDNTRSVLYQTYDGHRFHDAIVYKRLNVVEIDLQEVKRQADEAFIDALNIVREGGKSEYFRQFVHTEASGVILAPHNTTVQYYNDAGLANAPGELFTFDAKIEGTAKPTDFNLEEKILVKNGCKIMYLVNSEDNPLRNGTLGIFVSHNDCHYIRVGETDFHLEKYLSVKKEYVYDKSEDRLVMREIGSIEQYPFKLAYAMSIHKSQGLTFDDLTVDLRRPVFQKEQLYVALSRAKTPQGLRIIVK